MKFNDVIQLEAFFFILFGLGIGYLWHQFYVVPHDEARYAIMDCMGEETSKAAWDTCRDQLRPND